MSGEPTKACVMVLKCENYVKYILFYPFIKFFKYISKFLHWVVQFINWCIVRAMVRWVGLPILAWLFYEMCLAIAEKPKYINGVYDQTSFAIVVICCILIVTLGAFVLSAWVEVPDKEKEILTEYYKWLR